MVFDQRKYKMKQYFLNFFLLKDINILELCECFFFFGEEKLFTSAIAYVYLVIFLCSKCDLEKYSQLLMNSSI